MSKSQIEWCTDTWSPVDGCTPVSAGCANCWAKSMVRRFRTNKDFSQIVLHPYRLSQPLHWKKPRRIFVCPMGDLFHAQVMKEDNKFIFYKMMEIIDKCFQHTFIILTKRPENIPHYTFPANVWLGISIENQHTAEQRIPLLLQHAATIKFLSVEPMLMPIDLDLNKEEPNQDGCYEDRRHGISWVICGAESGAGRRECKIEWVRDLKDQCVIAGVPFFLKQSQEKGKLIKMPVLDGQQWREFPNEKTR